MVGILTEGVSRPPALDPVSVAEAAETLYGNAVVVRSLQGSRDRVLSSPRRYCVRASSASSESLSCLWANSSPQRRSDLSSANNHGARAFCSDGGCIGVKELCAERRIGCGIRHCPILVPRAAEVIGGYSRIQSFCPNARRRSAHHEHKTSASS